MPGEQEVVCHATDPNKAIDNNGIVHIRCCTSQIIINRPKEPGKWWIRTTWIWPRGGKHGQNHAEEQVHDSNIGNWSAESARIEFSRLEFIFAPDYAAEDWHAPGEIVTGYEEREQGIRSGVVD